MDQFGGFFEDSYIRGADYRSEYYGYQTHREAQFTIRVPKDNYTALQRAWRRWAASQVCSPRR